MKRLLICLVSLLIALALCLPALADTAWENMPTKPEDCLGAGYASPEEAILALLDGIDRRDASQVFKACLTFDMGITLVSKTSPEERDQFLNGLQFVEFVDLFQTSEYAQSQEFLAALKRDVTGMQVLDLLTNQYTAVDAEAVACAAVHVVAAGRDAWMFLTPVRVQGLWYNYHCEDLFLYGTRDYLLESAAGKYVMELTNKFDAMFTPVILPPTETLSFWELTATEAASCAPEVHSARLDSGIVQVDQAVFTVLDKETAKDDPSVLTAGQLCDALGQTPLDEYGQGAILLADQYYGSWMTFNLHPGTLDRVKVQLLTGYSVPLRDMRVTGIQLSSVRDGMVWYAGGIGRDGQRPDGSRWTGEELISFLEGQALASAFRNYDRNKQVKCYEVSTPHGGSYQFEVGLDGLVSFFYRNL